MNTSSDHDDQALLLAEYALGVLEASERAQVRQRVQADPLQAAALAQWEQRLAPLTEDIAVVAPPARVWSRIQADLGFASTAPRTAARPRFWNNLRAWRWVGLGATAAFAAMTLTFVVKLDHSASPAAVARYQVADLVQSGGTVAWTATIDVQHARVVLVPVTASNIGTHRAAELWLVPANGKPMSLGVLASDRPSTVALPRNLPSGFTAQASLAVSLEPVGGSPTGQPTGPILAHGAIHAV